MSNLQDFWLELAIREFASSYGSAIEDRTVDLVGKRKSLHKFGRNIAMSANTEATIWDLGVAHETYLDGASGTSSNLIDRISSSSGSDTGIIRIEGHYLSAANKFHFVILDATLTGQTPVDLANATALVDVFGGWSDQLKLARVSRVANLTATALVGDLYVYQNGQTVTAGVPQDLTLTHAKVRGSDGLNQTNKCATTISDEDFFIVTQIRAGVAKQSAAYVDFSFQVREPGGVFREKSIGDASRDSGYNPIYTGPPYLIVPPNSDIRIVGTSSANTTTGIAEFDGILGRLV